MRGESAEPPRCVPLLVKNTPGTSLHSWGRVRHLYACIDFIVALLVSGSGDGFLTTFVRRFGSERPLNALRVNSVLMHPLLNKRRSLDPDELMLMFRRDGA